MIVETIESNNRYRSEQCIKLNQDEWTAYSINSLDSKDYAITARVKSETDTATMLFSVNDVSQDISVTSKNGSKLH